MSAQQIFFIAGIIAFIAAAVFVGLSVYTFVREDILSVRDDLSGKRRQRDLEEGVSGKTRVQQGKTHAARAEASAPPEQQNKGIGKKKKSRLTARGKAAEDARQVDTEQADGQVSAGAAQTTGTLPDDDVTTMLSGAGDERTLVLNGKVAGSAEGSVPDAVRRGTKKNIDKDIERVAFRVKRRESSVKEGDAVIR